jgi:hypothetical protein
VQNSNIFTKKAAKNVCASNSHIFFFATPYLQTKYSCEKIKIWWPSATLLVYLFFLLHTFIHFCKLPSRDSKSGPALQQASLSYPAPTCMHKYDKSLLYCTFERASWVETLKNCASNGSFPTPAAPLHCCQVSTTIFRQVWRIFNFLGKCKHFHVIYANKKLHKIQYNLIKRLFILIVFFH